MTKTTAAAVLILSLAACSKEAPTPVSAAPRALAVVPEAHATAPQGQAAAPKADPNQELVRRVRAALEADTTVQSDAIDVTATDGAITLWGAVRSAAERERAESAVAAVQGVSSVSNQLAVVTGS